MDLICPDVTTTEIVPETHTITERVEVTTFNRPWLMTSPSLGVCAPYRDLAGKVGTNCSHRSLVSVPDSLSPDTEILLLDFNSLSSISLSWFKALPQLHDLSLSNNRIQNLDMDYPLPIKKLDLSSNSLTSLPNFRNLPQLRRLVLDHNKIPALPEGAFDNLIELDELSIRGNTIQVIPEQIFHPLENLRYLTLSENKIKGFPNNSLDKLEYLEKFDVSMNELITVPRNFFENNLIPYVYLHNNSWHCECDTVQYLREWIQSNDGNIYRGSGEADSESIVCLTPSAWRGIAIINLPMDLICPDVTTTEIVPETHTITERVEVTTFNRPWLMTSPSLGVCAPYRDLAGKVGTNCSHRSLVFVPDSLSPDTEILLLDFNSLSSISLSWFKALPQLHDLSLSNNRIQNLDMDYPLPIEKLDLSSNSLTNLPNFRNLPQLRRLVLDHNKIPALPEGAFDNLTALDELSIRGNAIQVIPEQIFHPLENLRYLTLSENKIKRFPNNSLDKLEYLEKFDVSMNELITVPRNFFENNLIPYVYLHNNSWHCECDTVQYLREWIQSNDGNIYRGSGEADSESVVCLTPSAWRGIAIINLPMDLICPDVTTTEIVPETHTITERVEVTTFNRPWLMTSPSLGVCAPYRDLAGKVGTNCSHRSLVSVPDSLSPDTEILLLDFNSLSSISLSWFKALPQLHDLSLSNNRIQNLDMDYPLPIKKLDLSSNSLTSLPNFRNLPQLRRLVLDHNKIPALPEGAFDNLIELDELSIRGNTIQVIPEQIFHPLENLRYLTLSENKIKGFPNNSLDKLEYLEKFDVSMNELITVPRNFFENNLIPYVYLHNNSWHCECDTVQYLREWIQSNDGNIYRGSGEADSESVVCLTPSAWRGIAIINLPMDLICPDVTTTEIVPETHTITERVEVTTFNRPWLMTSPSLGVCAPYRDLAGKVGTNCSHRSLVSVPDSLSPDTEILLLDFNSLSSISLSWFKALPQLHDLSLSNNRIQNLDMDYPLPIKKLDLSSNSLTSLPNFRNLPQLRRLVLDHNKIPALPEGAFDNLIELDELSIRGNTIQVIPEQIFHPLENLRYLTLSENKIKGFPNNSLDKLEYLEKFDVSMNELITVPRNFFENNLIPYVYLHNNSWHCECDTVQYLREWIQSNDGNIYRGSGEADSESIVCLTPSAWRGIAIINLPMDLICPDVTTTEIVPETHTITERVEVTTFNRPWLMTSPSLGVCAPYRDLAGKVGTNCSHRSLVFVPDSLSPDTEILLLDFNSLSSISLSWFKALPQLHDLSLSNNRIQNLDMDYPLPIEKLDLSSNSLTNLPNFRNLPQLRRLVLDHNKIPALPEGAFDNLTALDELSIRGNAIQVIPEQIFHPLENLRYLTLSENKIKRFPNNSLDKLEYLEKFDVSMNELITVPRNFFENNLIPYVYLHNNSWHCECDTVQYLREWIQSNDGNIYRGSGEADSESVVCLTPSAWRGIAIINLPMDLICPDVTTTEIVPETHTITERVEVTTFNRPWLMTSPSLGVCAPYRDLAGKVGTNCSHRSLVSVPDSLSPDTEILLLDFNSLSSISLSWFKALPQLHDLSLSNNRIQNLDMDYPLPIKKLDLSSNSLTSLPNFRNLPQLRRLVLDHNKIPALPEGAFDNLIELDELSIRGNTIQVIPEQIFHPLENLRYLTLSENKIKGFPNNSLDKLEYLEKFDVSMNELITVPRNFFENNLIPYVYLHNNSWHCECDTVQYLREWIQSNDGNIYRGSGEADSESIVCLTPSAWRGIAIINLPMDLICPDVTTTEIVPETHTITERVEVTTFNRPWLMTSPSLGVCAPYRDLAGKVGTNCSHRSLVFVPDSLSPDTEILLLDFNSLSSISLSWFKALPQLHDLSLSNNRIQNLDMDYPLPIEKLDLSSNSLTSLPNFRNLPQLRRLVLDHNKIPALPEGAFDNLTALDELSIRGNAIQVIPEQIFHPLENLRYLTLSENKIKGFPDNSLDRLEYLEIFDVSKNELRSIPRDFFVLNPVLNVYLSNNPWHCDCDSQYLSEWIKMYAGKVLSEEDVPDSTDLLCGGPPEVSGVPLIDFVSEMCRPSTPDDVTLTSIGSLEVTQTALISVSTEDTTNLWERRSGLLRLLSTLDSNCFLLFILHCLSLSLLLLEISALSLYTLKVHWQCYAPLKRLARQCSNIRLIRYSSLVPQFHQIYPLLSSGMEPGATGAAGNEQRSDNALTLPFEEQKHPVGPMEASAVAFDTFL
uniref:uncharacterized protein n=1 Tax=Pristiophorus japonicus TaxID=55135 RepID=UPI00398EA63A